MKIKNCAAILNVVINIKITGSWKKILSWRYNVFQWLDIMDEWHSILLSLLSIKINKLKKVKISVRRIILVDNRFRSKYRIETHPFVRCMYKYIAKSKNLNSCQIKCLIALYDAHIYCFGLIDIFRNIYGILFVSTTHDMHIAAKINVRQYVY